MDNIDAIGLYLGLRGQVIELWVWFVAGNFAALAACFSVPSMSNRVRVLFIFGFVVYAAGNLALIYNNTVTIQVLLGDMAAALQTQPSVAYRPTLNRVAKAQTPVYIPIAIHAIVDACVVLIVALHRAPVKDVPFSRGRTL